MNNKPTLYDLEQTIARLKIENQLLADEVIHLRPLKEKWIDSCGKIQDSIQQYGFGKWGADIFDIACDIMKRYADLENRV